MDIGAYVGHGWNTFKANPGPYIVITIALLVVNVVIQLAGNLLPFVLGTLVSFGVSGLVLGALCNMGLKGSRGQSVELADVAIVLQRPVDYIVVGLAVSIGFIGCCVGVFVTQTLFTFAAFLVLQGVGYQEALSKSLELVQPRFTDVLLLTLVVFVLNVAGGLMCGLGLLVSIPVSFIALAKAFDDFGFAGSTGAGSIVTPPPSQPFLP